MADPSLPELEAQRVWLYGQLAATGDFRRDTVSENYRRCGKPNCACARPEHPGHRAGPQLPRPVPGLLRPGAGAVRVSAAAVVLADRAAAELAGGGQLAVQPGPLGLQLGKRR